MLRVAIIGLTLAAAVPAAATEALVAWPTYVRAGPNARAAALDEVLRGTRLDVRSCDGAWCLVRYDRADGYVRRAALDGTDFPAGPAPGTACFDSRRAGYGRGEVYRYCPR